MWSDNESDIDLLGFQHLKSAVLSVIQNDSLLPATIGVFGDWGSGKSSLMKMVSADLRAQDTEDVLVLTFNGWLFEGYEDAKTALIGTIVDEIVSRRTLGKKVKDSAKRLGLRLLKKIQFLRLLGAGARTAMAYAVGGAPAAGAIAAAEGTSYMASQVSDIREAVNKINNMSIEDVENKIKSDVGNDLRQSIRDFRGEFENLLSETNIKTLVVLIDDLDRCMPDTIIETLEAIKLFLFVPRTAFVIGADERLVRYAVRRRFPELPGEKTDVGQDYLEKLVQYPVRLPPLGRAEMETYINLLFTKRANVSPVHFETIRRRVANSGPSDLLEVRYNHGIAKEILGDSLSPELAENLSLAQRIAPVLAVGLTGNPRQCKRFLNTLVMRMDMAKSRDVTLKSAVLAKLMILERFYTESYKQLAAMQAEQAGKPMEIAIEEGRLKRKNPLSDTDSEVPDVNDNITDDVVELIPAWLADPAIGEWIASPPHLSGVDLRPYFYFSRDTLTPLASTIQRMTPVAQEVLAGILHASQAQRTLSIKRSKELGAGDVSAIFQTIGKHIRMEDDLGSVNSPLWKLLEFIGSRKDLLGQMIALLTDLPDSDLPVSLPPRIKQLAKTADEKTLVKKLLEKWSRNTTNTPLKNAAASMIQRDGERR